MGKIDIEKLRALGIPEEVIARMDPLDGGNIDANGNVLFLDEERQKSKERPEKPLRKNKLNPINNILARTISKKINGPDRDVSATFESFVDQVSKPLDDPKHIKIMKLMGFHEGGYTGGSILPLNVDLSEDTVSSIIPMDLAIKAMETAEFIAIVNVCVCREAFGCKDFPVDLGCIFINSAGRRVVESDLAREATVEEAKAHILRAKEAGLFCNAEFVEGEQVIWGLMNKQMNEFRMFCFCCDCCCLALKFLMHGSKEDKKRYQSCGFTATVDHDKCVGCQKCQTRCRVSAISYRKDGKCRIDQDMCLGCGFCKDECAAGAIRILQTFPMRENVNDYFLKEIRIDDKITSRKIAEQAAKEAGEAVSAKAKNPGEG